jgi:branched-chain amino acid transport system permease protein
MSAYLGYLLAGLGGGAVVASLALGLVLTSRTSGVVNFAHAAMGAYIAFAYFEFRDKGNLVLPFIGLPARVHLLKNPTLFASLVFAVVLSAVLGLLIWALVFRPLRQAPALARVVASLGLFLYLQEVTRLRFTTAGAARTTYFPVLPTTDVHLLGTAVTTDRLLLAAGSVAVTVVLAVVFRRTRFGLATRAAASNEKGALLTGISPDRVGALNWVLATVLAGFAVILLQPISGLDAGTTSLLVVPALAALLIGGLSSFAITTAAGLGIGMVQSLILGYASRPEVHWIPSWLPVVGLQQLVPVVLVGVALVWRGDPLPTRSAVAERRLPPSPTPRHVSAWTLALGLVVAVGGVVVGADLRQAIMVTLIASLLSLSVVVLTGYVGQISLAPLAIAGVAGFATIDLSRHGWPFPLAALAATLIAAVAGVLVGLPAGRVRGMVLAVATIAMAVAIEGLVLGNPSFTGGAGGRSAPRPYLFGIDVGVSARGTANFRPPFGLMVLGVVALTCAVVANLRRNRTGLRWLAVRANERAAAAAGIDVGRSKLGAFAFSSALAGLAGVFLAGLNAPLSVNSFMVIGSLVALALTYLAGISSIGGALLAGVLAQAGLLTTVLDRYTGDAAGKYVFAISGLSLIATAIGAPDGVTGRIRSLLPTRPAPTSELGAIGVAGATGSAPSSSGGR